MNAKLGWLAAGALAVACAMRPAERPQDVSTPTSDVTMGVGSTEAGRNDLVFVLYKRANPDGNPPDRLTLATYKNMSNDVRHPKMEFRGAREVTYDVLIPELVLGDAEHAPSVKELKDAYDKNHSK